MHEKIIVTMRKIATTIAFLDTGCLMLVFYCSLFGQRPKYLEVGQNFSTGGTASMPLASWLLLPHMQCVLALTGVQFEARS